MVMTVCPRVHWIEAGYNTGPHAKRGFIAAEFLGKSGQSQKTGLQPAKAAQTRAFGCRDTAQEDGTMLKVRALADQHVMRGSDAAG